MRAALLTFLLCIALLCMCMGVALLLAPVWTGAVDPMHALISLPSFAIGALFGYMAQITYLES